MKMTPEFIAVPASPSRVRVDPAMMERRREITRKFMSGEWSVELDGFEEGNRKDKLAAERLAKAWNAGWTKL